MSEEPDAIIADMSDLDKHLDSLDAAFNRTSIVRNKVVDQMVNGLESLKLDEGGNCSAAMLASKTAYVNTLTTTLNDIDKASTTRVKLVMADKRTEALTDLSHSVNEFMVTLGAKPTRGMLNDIDYNGLDQAIDAEFSERELAITDGELKTSETDLLD